MYEINLVKYNLKNLCSIALAVPKMARQTEWVAPQAVAVPETARQIEWVAEQPGVAAQAPPPPGSQTD